MVIRRGDVVLAPLEPVVGSEIGKTRPCLVISPDEMNRHAPTIIVAPLTTKPKPYPWRVGCDLDGIEGQVMLDQIRTISKDRVLKQLSATEPGLTREVLDGLARLFAL